MIIFGLSCCETQGLPWGYAQAMAARFSSGLFSATVSVLRSYAADVTDSESQPRVFSLLAFGKILYYVLSFLFDLCFLRRFAITVCVCFFSVKK